jgi:hypothetical protein
MAPGDHSTATEVRDPTRKQRKPRDDRGTTRVRVGMSRFVLLSCVLGLAACFPIASAPESRRPDYMAPVKALDGTIGTAVKFLASRSEHTKLGGTLPRDLKIQLEDKVSDKLQIHASSTTPMAYSFLWFESLAEGRICFTSTEDLKASSDAERHGRELMETLQFTVRSASDLDAIAKERVWSADHAKLDKVEVTRDKTTDVDTDSGIKRRRTAEYRFCGAAPAVDAATQYLLVAVKGDGDRRDGLLVWKLVDR